VPDLDTVFDWIEGDRTFSIVFGTITAGACFAMAIPTLWWFLPSKKRWIFPQSLDPHRYLQLAFGLFAMAMAFTNALCRYIPHGHLGVVHPVFFVTTLTLAAILGPRVIATARGRTLRASFAVYTAALAVLVTAPLAAVVNAFWF
jgi:hypothetical protein